MFGLQGEFRYLRVFDVVRFSTLRSRPRVAAMLLKVSNIGACSSAANASKMRVASRHLLQLYSKPSAVFTPRKQQQKLYSVSTTQVVASAASGSQSASAHVPVLLQDVLQTFSGKQVKVSTVAA